MKKSLVLGMALLMGGVLGAPQTMADEVKSLRSGFGIESGSLEAAPIRWQDDREPIARDYVQQPPLVPHSVEDYNVTIKFNKCLTCHSWANYKQANATKISQTHFEDRMGDVHANVAARRYFCMQCHVPQANAQPLVENQFEPVTAVKQR